jgi:hypothetical protein
MLLFKTFTMATAKQHQKGPKKFLNPMEFLYLQDEETKKRTLSAQYFSVNNLHVNINTQTKLLKEIFNTGKRSKHAQQVATRAFSHTNSLRIKCNVKE